jgi:hypothetical protein
MRYFLESYITTPDWALGYRQYGSPVARAPLSKRHAENQCKESFDTVSQTKCRNGANSEAWVRDRRNGLPKRFCQSRHSFPT